MSVRNALLTLLAERPQHGYQLKAEFDAATAEAWPLNFGQVYATLQRLEKAGLIEHEGADDRTVYHITGAGRDAVELWMSEPVARPLASRDELSVKLLLALATDVADPRNIINSQRQSTVETLQSVTALKAEAAAESGHSQSALAWLLHLDRMAMMAETEVRWLDLVEERLANRPTTGSKNQKKEPGERKKEATTNARSRKPQPSTR